MSQSPLHDPTVSRRVDRDPAEVWEQLTSPDGFEQWMGPGSTIEPGPGGALIAADPESGEPKIGRVLDVDPGRSIRWVWRAVGDDPDGATTTEVAIELEPADPHPATVITVTERPTMFPVATPLPPVASACAGIGARAGAR